MKRGDFVKHASGRTGVIAAMFEHYVEVYPQEAEADVELWWKGNIDIVLTGDVAFDIASVETDEGRPARARLDPEGTARSKTELRAAVLSTNPNGTRTCFPGPAIAHLDTETGVRTPLKE